MSFYDFDVNIISPQLMPPVLRQPSHLNWFKVILIPIQYLWQLIFNDYVKGSIYGNWNHLIGYSAGSRVIYSDKAVYETPNGAGGNSQSPANPLYWFKINDNFIGSNERVKYNSQIIIFEFALNRWFQNPQPNPQIYISNTPTTSQFLMGKTSAYSNVMAQTSLYQPSYMGNTFTVVQYDYTIFVPTALLNALPPVLLADKKQVVRNFADKYNLAGMNYQVTPY